MAYTDIDNPELYFQAKNYTGNASTNAITLDGSENMQPDMVWLKSRSFSQNHELYDSVRGATKRLYPNGTYAEDTNSTGVTAFNSDGFTLGSSNAINKSGDTFASWNWKAGGGSGSSNEDGSINTTSTSVSTTAGFSISKFTGTNSNQTVGHGLGAAPTFIIIKNLGTTEHWGVGATALNNWNNYIPLSDADVSYNDATMWNDTAPTSTVFTVGTGNITNDQESMVAYCFAPKQGFSKFGSYTGNGNNDGTFVFCGFRPAWLMIKQSDATGTWIVVDNKRDGYNSIDKNLSPANSNAEDSGTDRVDFLSNGFKIRVGSSSAWNGSGSNIIYMAFAEQPFVNSKGVPCNAR